MMGHNTCFKGVLRKIIPKLSHLPLLTGALKRVLNENLMGKYLGCPFFLFALRLSSPNTFRCEQTLSSPVMIQSITVRFIILVRTGMQAYGIYILL